MGKDASIPKPVMSGMLIKQITKNLTLTIISCIVAACYMKFVFGYGRQRKFAEFYKNYDIDKEFHNIRRKGLFDSCDMEDDGDDE